jgi:hypothetical protein
VNSASGISNRRLISSSTLSALVTEVAELLFAIPCYE